MTPEIEKNKPKEVKRKTIYHELKEGMEKAKLEKQKKEEAFKKYAGYGEEYRRRNDERIQTGKVKVDSFGDNDLTIIASINVNRAGEAISGHDYNPEAECHRVIEASYNEWLTKTQPSQRLVIFEGDRRPRVESRDRAITQGTESGLLQHLSDRDGVEAVSGDPTKEAQAQYLEERGISGQEAALYFLIRNLTHGSLGKESSEIIMPGDISMQIYGQAALMGIEGFEMFSEEQKRKIAKNAERMQQLRAQGRAMAESMNLQLQGLGLPTFEIGTDDDPNSVNFRSGQDIVKLAESWDPTNQTGRLAEIQRIITKCRDKHLFELIADAVRSGKKPFVAYGGSHVVSLEPVFEDYFKKV